MSHTPEAVSRNTESMALRLRSLQTSDEAVIRAAHQSISRDEGFDFARELTPAMSWAQYLALHDDYRRGVNLPDGIVPETFLVATVDDVIVGRSSIRHALNDNLLRRGGHIGYGVVRQYRRRGYGTEILRQSLRIAREIGIRDILVTCGKDNEGSRRIIESCGGVLESVEPSPNGTLHRRYWITCPE
ncbi:GNAT family N-acetyltransferase [Nocardia sp. GAS34]|uniref:GNAT family N-acetyltransferase n=1 Tax=unclassified Nocardia TaxID=2637762 RepID=UPI003D2321C0